MLKRGWEEVNSVNTHLHFGVVRLIEPFPIDDESIHVSNIDEDNKVLLDSIISVFFPIELESNEEGIGLASSNGNYFITIET